MSVRSFARVGKLKVQGSFCGQSLSVLNCCHLGSSISLRGFSRIGNSLSVLDFLRLGSSLSLRSFCRIGSAMSVLDFLQLGSSLSIRAFARLGSKISAHAKASFPRVDFGNSKYYALQGGNAIKFYVDDKQSMSMTSTSVPAPPGATGPPQPPTVTGGGIMHGIWRSD